MRTGHVSCSEGHEGGGAERDDGAHLESWRMLLSVRVGVVAIAGMHV